MRNIFTILLVCLTHIICAQDFKEKFISSFEIQPRPVVAFGLHHTFINNNAEHMRHIFLGANFKNVTRVGLSINWLKQPSSFIWFDTLSSNHFKMQYIAPRIEYVFFRTQHWELNIPVQLGFGRSFYQETISGKKLRSDQGMIVLYEPAMTIQYRFWDYIGIGGGAGFRLMLVNNKYIDDKLSSLSYMAWIKIFFGDLYKDYVKKEK